ncbi:stage III sporulation protein AD [Sporanaerobium hydrogeniformans]|uniref:Stage III sporulation protein AD n=1 Tax=Sporanaerobium hydrogeniformans TaxID=3072179 RepID=A0AC61DHV0_9FIRM|nr:stage III sporulation protein AD [Lachnospiraceae bacterium]PHV72357.1 stage III sporulation protein AD [Sporanaerobium hydrogeniformans]
MEILQLIGFAMTSVMLIMLVGKYNNSTKAFSLIIRLATVVLFMLFIVQQLGDVFRVIQELASKVNMESGYLNIILKIIGIAYIAEFGYQLCKDAGEEAIGSKIQLAGKVMIFVISAPVIFAVVEMVAGLL